MIELDGAHGEGGGAILRTALALSLAIKKPFSIKNIRANRKVPGLKNQHLHAIRLIEELTASTCKGAKLGAKNLVFYPGKFIKTKARINTQTAASITLLLQAILLPCLLEKKAFDITIIGGTDVAWSQPIDHFRHVFLPAIDRHGQIKCFVKRTGFYPKGGGEVQVVLPKEWDRIPIKREGELLAIAILAKASNQLQGVAERLADATKFSTAKKQIQYVKAASPGCSLLAFADFGEGVRVGVARLGEKRESAELIGASVGASLKELLSKRTDEHVADMLIPYLPFIGGAFKLPKKTSHIDSNLYVVEQFLKGCIRKNKLLIEPIYQYLLN